MYKEEKELWVKFACAALSGLLSDYDQSPADPKDAAAIVWEYADCMLDAYKEKFKGC